MRRWVQATSKRQPAYGRGLLKRMDSLLAAARGVIEKLRAVRDFVAPLTADECRPEFAYLRQALSEELTRILQSEFGGWSPEEREDLLTLACQLCRQLGEVFWEQALTSFNPDSPHDEVGTLGDEYLAIAYSLGTFSGTSTRLFALQPVPTLN
jgi:hypothetical protein